MTSENGACEIASTNNRQSHTVLSHQGKCSVDQDELKSAQSIFNTHYH